VRLRATATAAIAAGLLLAGCAADDADPADDAAAEIDATAQDTGQEAAEEAADDPPAADGGETDAADAADIGEPADAADATRTIAVDAFDMAFDPETIEVAPGEVVTFEVTNTGGAVHEFFLGDSAMQQDHAEEMAEMGHGMPHDEPYSIRVDPGQTKQLTWRFADGGIVEFACHEPGHYQAGMYGRITVD
jgi:uncharacterized cupredoxin-like copper-binding protein